MHQTPSACPAPSTTSPTAHAAPPAPKALRTVQASCRCIDHLEHGEPAPSAPLALVGFQADKTEADALDHLAKAMCYSNYLETQMEEMASLSSGSPADEAKGRELQDRIDAANKRQRVIEQITAQRWGVTVAIDHDF